MKTQELNITDSLDNQIFNTYDDALQFGIENYGWEESEVLERKEELTVKIEGKFETIKLDCLMVYPGSVDYLFFLNW